MKALSRFQVWRPSSSLTSSRIPVRILKKALEGSVSLHLLLRDELTNTYSGKAVASDGENVPEDAVAALIFPYFDAVAASQRSTQTEQGKCFTTAVSIFGNNTFFTLQQQRSESLVCLPPRRLLSNQTRFRVSYGLSSRLWKRRRYKSNWSDRTRA